MQGKDGFFDYQCSQLVRCLRDFDQDLKQGLHARHKNGDLREVGERYAQAVGVVSLCAVVATRNDYPPHVIETYERLSQVFTRLAYFGLVLCEEFDDNDKAIDRAKHLGNLQGESIQIYEVDPIELFDVAMDAARTDEKGRTLVQKMGLTLFQ